MRGADVGLDLNLLVAKVRQKITKVRKGEGDRVRFEVSKLRDSEIRNTFKLVLQSRFEALQQLMEEEELSMDDEWSLCGDLREGVGSSKGKQERMDQ